MNEKALEAGAKFYWDHADTETPWDELTERDRAALIASFRAAVAAYEAAMWVDESAGLSPRSRRRRPVFCFSLA